MRKFILSLLLSAFVFISLHDYIIETIDQDTQRELYLYESGQVSDVCDVTQAHQTLHDSTMAINTITYNASSAKSSYTLAHTRNSFVPLAPSNTIYFPPIV